ncbi:MAG: aminopeptidase P family protein [Bacteroidales bacterium]|jgi:Xaa-Pro aminopeptidase|nr:aminopeptidase P family protein [Bacteroidales bacterium]MDD2203743.1 aminopeptidase P family protein [Bacteroidales bacterium]MDD3152930.1 aminopeptidase P family protein [Bacteroidales bacterium]MDD3913319.1 aminopeptidase P family protein [Bacteroidales bacterium]MDD4633350.1 aminopeptidase P family protein [Bacteroidales bacterium]
MFNKEVYTKRRNKLQTMLSSGVVLILGNNEVSYNYPDNTYRWRQDSNFSYFFGLNLQGLAGIIDIDNNEHIIFGTELTVDDIVWMGSQPTLKENAAKAGINITREYSTLQTYLNEAVNKGRKIHFLPPYRGEHYLELEKLLGINYCAVNRYVSKELVKAVISLREIKEDVEIEEIEKAVLTAYDMHTTAMKMAKTGVYEYEIAGTIEGIALKHNNFISFPVILSINGQTLHNHSHSNLLKEGRMLVVDAGAETELLYASDITRSIPVGGKFNSRQKDIYEAVLAANMKGIENIRIGQNNVDNHIAAVTTLLEHLKELKMVKGNVHDAVMNGAGGFFMPHGLGHQMGMDVHDMEGLGENLVGYDKNLERSTIPGIRSLRMGKKLKKGHVFTVEPGCYFIPELFNQWKSQGMCTEFINYDVVEKYLDFGGIRIEDDVLVTDDKARVLGKPIPKTVKEIENICD